MNPGTMQIIILVAMFAIFYGIMIIPQSKKKKAYSNMINELKVGDRILTIGGLIGRIVEVDAQYVVIEAEPSNTKLKFSKRGISSLITEENNM